MAYFRNDRGPSRDSGNRNFSSNRGGGFGNRNSGGGGFGDRGPRRSTEVFQAVCDNCGKNCDVPFRPTQGKPVLCRECFADQKNGGSSFNSRPSRNDGPRQSDQPDYGKQIQALNSKLDEILSLLRPQGQVEVVEAVIEEPITEEIETESEVEEKPKAKTARKSSKA